MATSAKDRKGDVMTDTNTTPAAKPVGKIKEKISSPMWVRVMRIVIAAIAGILLYHAIAQFMAGKLAPTDAWLAGMIGTLGLTALVEAIWPNGNHGLLQYWGLTALASSALVAWAMGGAKWIGILGLLTLVTGFAIAVLEAAKDGSN